jgi:hypothetical protein
MPVKNRLLPVVAGLAAVLLARPAAAQVIPDHDAATASMGLTARSVGAAPRTAVLSEWSGEAEALVAPRGEPCAVSCQQSSLSNAELSDIPNGVRCADDFLAMGTSISRICFWGVYLNNTPPSSDSFEVRIFRDVNGVPGTQIFSRTVFTFNGSLTPAQPTGRILGGTFTEYEHHITLSPPATVSSGQCYWIQIRNLSVTGSNGWGWMYSVGGGNGRYMIDTTPGNAYANYNQSHGFIPDPASPEGFPLDVDSDLAWCMDIATGATDACGPAFVDAPCPLTNETSCQPVDTNDDTAHLLVADGVVQTIADDFTPAQSGSVLDLCWTGVYNTFNPVGDSFRITFFSDAGGRPGPIIRRFNPGQLTITRGWSGEKILRLVPYFEYHAHLNLGDVVLNAGECYWLEIVNLTTADQWLWPSALGGNGNALRDGGGNGQPLDGYNAGDDEPHDMAFCITQPISVFDGCDATFAAPPNDDCADARPIVVDAAAISGTTLGSLSDPEPPPCGDNLIDGGGVWYTLLGTGATLTASLCHPGTDYDAAIAVYCGECANLTCIGGGNNDPDCPQSPNTAIVSWRSAPGQRYYIRVSGDLGVVGNFQIDVVSDHAPAVPEACEACRVSPTDPRITRSEFEACGTAAGGNGACAGAELINIGDTVLGTAFADAGLSDIDAYRFAVGEVDFFDITITAEFPALVQVDRLAPDCSSQQTLFGGAFITQPCDEGRLVAALLQPGEYIVRVQPNGFHGLPCGAHNNYLLTLDFAPLGACCLPDQSCLDVPEVECLARGGAYLGDGTECATAACRPAGACCLGDGSCVSTDEADCGAQGGAYQGDGTTCDAVTCPATGACCFADGSCEALTEAQCAEQGGEYQGDDVDCAEANCPVPLGACCLPDGSCVEVPPSLCELQQGVYGGDGSACTPDPCNVACPCEADGDASQVNVFDLLAYLDLWFESDPAAEMTGSEPVDVFDLLGYLDCWFNASAGNPCE